MPAAALQIPQVPPDSCGVRRVAFKAMGTACAIQFRCADEKTALKFLAEALGWLGRFEARYSRFKPDSIVSRINAAAGKSWVPVDSEMDQMLDLADSMHRLTQGILDAAMLPLILVWDWKKVHERLPSDAEIGHALSLSSWKCVQRRPGEIFLPREGMGLDFGGFGKEYAVDQVIAIARRYGISDALVDLGRDILAIGGNGRHPFWHVGIQSGLDPEQCIGGLAVSGHAVCASGDYARRFEHHGVRYGHILDPRTGWPVSHGLRAVTVLAPTCAVAGIYATCVFVLGGKAGLRFADAAPGVEACVQDDRGVGVTRGFIKHQVKAA
jgi:thiamine biosynthesis lipoprotein